MRLLRAFQFGDRAVSVFMLLAEQRQGDWMPRAWMPMFYALMAGGAYSLAHLALYLINT
jgi:hypothetical protein